MVRILENNGRNFLTIPKEYLTHAGIKKGDEVLISYNERGNLEIIKVKNE